MDDVSLIAPSELVSQFMIFLDTYRESPDNGIPLGELLKHDWGFFSNVGEKELDLLLPQLFDDKEIVSKKFEPIPNSSPEYTHQWEDFRQELKYHNRFFPSMLPDLDTLKGLMSFHLEEDVCKLPESLYRSRIEEPHYSIGLENMGKPPVDQSTNGRANPIGIPYLYLASDVETAIAEIRPPVGQKVAVAFFRKKDSLGRAKIIDLCNPRKSTSPFEQSDNIVSLRYELDFLSHLSDELSMPVLPDTASLDYLPSQYICEFIKNIGYSGVKYRSSVGKGTNYALFDDFLFEPCILTHYIVSKIDLRYNQCV